MEQRKKTDVVAKDQDNGQAAGPSPGGKEAPQGKAPKAPKPQKETKVRKTDQDNVQAQATQGRSRAQNQPPMRGQEVIDHETWLEKQREVDEWVDKQAKK
ncbi:hypothetical protein VZT92_011454 [Zoarces viviparus]|uniref:Uncharacterized protein n=1 Tax=Zoarces viviparus TaxID=48416 RepID=A0AAW1F5E9_ZOAVI